MLAKGKDQEGFVTDVSDLATVSDMEKERAYRIVALRGRAHKFGAGRYVTVHVHAQTAAECELLRRYIGGNYYKHGNGFLWQASSAQARKSVLEALKTVAPSGIRMRFHEWPEALAVVPPGDEHTPWYEK